MPSSDAAVCSAGGSQGCRCGCRASRCCDTPTGSCWCRCSSSRLGSPGASLTRSSPQEERPGKIAPSSCQRVGMSHMTYHAGDRAGQGLLAHHTTHVLRFQFSNALAKPGPFQDTRVKVSRATEPSSAGGSHGRCGGLRAPRRRDTPTGSSWRRGPSPRPEAPGSSPTRGLQDRLQRLQYTANTSPAPTPRRCRACHTGPRHWV